MKTREQALREAGEVFADVLAIVSKLTPRQAAERAWHPGGPSIDVLTEQIAAAGICKSSAPTSERAA